MKTFKIFIQILLVVILISLLMIVFASKSQAQSDRKINRLSQETGLYVRSVLHNTTDGIYNETELSCKEELVTHFINKRHFIAHTQSYIYDLEIKKRRVGQYKSWLGLAQDGRYFLITPFTVQSTEDNSYGHAVIIQPVSAQYVLMFDLPTVTISNFGNYILINPK